MSTHLYTHPYKRGFHVIIDREGFWRASLLLWRWEFTTHIGVARMCDDIMQQRIKTLEAKVASLQAELARKSL